MPVQSSGREESLEKGLATYSSILSWRIPWTEEPGGIQSMEVTKSWTQYNGKEVQQCSDISHDGWNYFFKHLI